MVAPTEINAQIKERDGMSRRAIHRHGTHSLSLTFPILRTVDHGHDDDFVPLLVHSRQ